MKMVCPHCGVKGSADDSLLNRKVKCPKCRGHFTIAPEVIQPIPVADFELEQLDDTLSADDITTEVDDIFDDIFGKDEEEKPTSFDNQEEIEKLLDVSLDDVQDENENLLEQDHTVAALSDSEDMEEEGDEDHEIGLEEWAKSPAALSAFDDDDLEIGKKEEAVVQSDVDETLTVVEELSELKENEERELTLDDFKTIESEDALRLDGEEAEGDDFDWKMAESDAAFNDPSLEERVDDALLEEDDGDAEISEVEEDAGEEQNQTAEYGETDEAEVDIADEYEVIRKCDACGEYVDPESKHEHGANVYCEKCTPTAILETKKPAVTDSEATRKVPKAMAAPTAPSTMGRFTIGTLIKDAWQYSKGAKASIWAAILFMNLILFGIFAAGYYFLPVIVPDTAGLNSLLAASGLQIFSGFISYILTAGIIVIAVKKVGGLPFSWKMVFSGLKRIGALIVAIILQFILVTIGFCLLVLPGIYLSIGYTLTLPLILVKGLSPWKAMEASRIAIHKRWWTVFFAFIVMGIIAGISALPAGIGLIWTVPMFFIMIGVLYYHFFGDEE